MKGLSALIGALIFALVLVFALQAMGDNLDRAHRFTDEHSQNHLPGDPETTP